MKDPGRTLELGATISTAAVSKIPKAALSTISDVKSYHQTGKGMSVGKFS